MKKQKDEAFQQRKKAGTLVAGSALGLVMALKMCGYDIDKLQNLAMLRNHIDALEKLHLHLSLNQAYEGVK